MLKIIYKNALNFSTCFVIIFAAGIVFKFIAVVVVVVVVAFFFFLDSNLLP